MWVDPLTFELSVKEIITKCVFTFCSVSGSSDLVPVLEAVHDVVNWQYLGLTLGLEKSQLDIMDRNCRGIVEDCRKEMISRWLHTGNASWRALVRALSSPLVGKRDLAMKIAAEHTKCEKHVV